MAEIIDFTRERKKRQQEGIKLNEGKEVWRCECGCQSFWYLDTAELQCVHCENVYEPPGPKEKA